MTIKQKIQADFVEAMKAKNETAKAALSSIKAAITVAEKTDGSTELADADTIKILTKAIKQREESQKIYEQAGRTELADKEAAEAEVLKAYMPAQMTEQEIVDALTGIMQSFSGVITNPQALIGKTIGEFNKQYQGRADIGTVKMLVNQLVEA